MGKRRTICCVARIAERVGFVGGVQGFLHGKEF